MIQTFRNAATQDIFEGQNTKQARKDFPRELWTAMRKKLDLKHTMKGYHSIRVNDRFRVTFRFEQGHAYDVAIEDYH
jgi:proteic killer suppression protein